MNDFGSEFLVTSLYPLLERTFLNEKVQKRYKHFWKLWNKKISNCHSNETEWLCIPDKTSVLQAVGLNPEYDPMYCYWRRCFKELKKKGHHVDADYLAAEHLEPYYTLERIPVPDRAERRKFRDDFKQKFTSPINFTLCQKAWEFLLSNVYKLWQDHLRSIAYHWDTWSDSLDGQNQISTTFSLPEWQRIEDISENKYFRQLITPYDPLSTDPPPCFEDFVKFVNNVHVTTKNYFDLA